MTIDDYVIVSLSDMLKLYGESTTISTLSEFKSAHDSSTESFLKRNAISMEKRDLCRTYLAVSRTEPSIHGYISLSIKCLNVPIENMLPSTILRGMNIDSSTGVAQSYLLGQLSHSTDAPKGLGGEMLDLAFDYLRSAKDIVGCRMVRLDCNDDLVDYYTDHGFRMIAKNKDGNLNQMMTFILPKPDKGQEIETG